MKRLFTFASVHQAIKADELLAVLGVEFTVLPTPQEIDVSCGLCIVVEEEAANRIEAVFVDKRIVWKKQFSYNSINGVKIYEKLAEADV